MRKTLLLTAAALTVGIITSTAQTYSANVVGYVNKAFKGGYFVLSCNPLQGTNNALSTIIPNPPDNTQVYLWDTGMQDFQAAVPTYVQATGQWVPNPTVNPGQGIFVVGGTDFTNTFVGEVLQGNITNNVVGGGYFQALASPVPVGGSITNVLAGYVPTDNDQVYMWDTDLQDFQATIPTYVEATGLWTPDANLAVGDGFFLVRSGGDTQWVRSFTVQ